MAVSPQRLALEKGRTETAAALRGWLVAGRGRVVAGWAGGAAAIGVVLLLVALAVAESAAPSGGGFMPLAADPEAGLADVASLLLRNGTVLLLHTLVCFASYLARRSVPLQAAHTTGLNRRVHDHAGPLALLAVAGCTAYSLGLQAWVLGHDLAAAAPTVGQTPAGLLARLALHALPELTAVFLPLAACLALGRRRAWNALAAAALLSAACAVPVIALAAVTEVYLTRLLL